MEQANAIGTDLGRSLRSETHCVARRFLVRTFGFYTSHLYIDKLNAHRFCSFCSPRTSASDEERRSVTRCVDRFMYVVHRPLTRSPLFFRDSLSYPRIQRSRKEAQILEIMIAGSKGQLKIGNVYSGSFSARTARSLKLA
jgi:hypothetical protein